MRTVKKNIVKIKSWKREFADLVEDSLSYLGKHKKYVYFSAFLFFVSAIFGYIFSTNLSFLDKFLDEIIDSTKDLDYLQLIWFIFSNNVTSSISVLFLGVFFGLFPLFNALFNGSILGYVYSKVAPVAGYTVIWRLIPHGVFELPAIFISIGLGIHLGISFFSINKMKNFRLNLMESLKVFLVIVVPLLALASIIESSLIVLFG